MNFKKPWTFTLKKLHVFILYKMVTLSLDHWTQQ